VARQFRNLFAGRPESVDLKPFRRQFCGADARNCGFFDYSIGEKFVELAYQEAKDR
jgi:hypothetical protein